MTARVSAADQDYMRRLGEFKAWSKREALARHLELSINERIEAGFQLTRRGPYFTAPRHDDEDLAAFFERAKRLGLYER
jgi:hypothetical protein